MDEQMNLLQLMKQLAEQQLLAAKLDAQIAVIAGKNQIQRNSK